MNAGKTTNLEFALSFGLNEEEYQKIIGILGREPNNVELGMYSVMWSEHCSYKNSIAELKKLPRQGERLLVGAGEENAGLVDIGNGLAVAFKIESHNHPSAIEPFQGAATGVGGIMRDIFTMGARPIAALNSLRFGNPLHPRTKYLVKGIVKGIGDYGNSFGVPTVAGDVYFEDCYNENPLVNAMSVGIVKHSEIAKSAAKGSGNLVMIVGSSTGRDGIHGATFASDNISDESEHKRPSVQVGDPFTEKLLLEATLEAIRAGWIVGIQDMGAAGITCSTSEMSARGGCGMVIDLDKVPMREANMSAYEIMLSESQERMLLVIEPRNEERVRDVFARWDLHCQTIGRVSDDGQIVVKKNNQIVAEVPAESLVLGGGAPVYHRNSVKPAYIDTARMFDPNFLIEPAGYNQVLLNLLGSPNICSRRWVYGQFDNMVRTNTLVYGCTDAAVVRIKGSEKALAIKTDCNPRYVYLNPYVGSKIAVAEAARNVVCVGARPIAITNCLNFGDPYDPEVFWQFKEAIRGISDACKVLETPVTGGNVSFYNESPSGAIYPTPVIGMLGELNSFKDHITAGFKQAGDVIIQLGVIRGHIGGSEYLKMIHNKIAGDAPPIDLEYEKKLQETCLELNSFGMLNSCHDVSEGGLAVCVAECCIYSHPKLGANLNIDFLQTRPDYYLFGEDQSVIVISTRRSYVSNIQRIADQHGVHCQVLGDVTEGNLMCNDLINMELEEVEGKHLNSFPVEIS